MTLTPEIQHVRGLLLRAIAEKGDDYVYKAELRGTVPPDEIVCNYFEDDGQPGCIVGHILHYEGITGVGGREGDSAFSVTGELTTWDPGVREALTSAQASQDAGETWGEALAAFDRRASKAQ